VYIFTVVKNLALNKKRTVPIRLYCLNCKKFGQLILRNIIKIVATRCHILRLKCTRFNFGWGSARRNLAGFKGPTFKGRDVSEGEGMAEEWRGGKGRRGKRRGGEGKERGPPSVPQLQICHYTTGCG